MGEEDNYNDFIEVRDYENAFKTAKVIMNRKISKNLMYIWVENCIECIDALGKGKLLSENFYRFSCYKQREIINKIEI